VSDTKNENASTDTPPVEVDTNALATQLIIDNFSPSKVRKHNRELAFSLIGGGLMAGGVIVLCIVGVLSWIGAVIAILLGFVFVLRGTRYQDWKTSKTFVERLFDHKAARLERPRLEHMVKGLYNRYGVSMDDIIGEGMPEENIKANLDVLSPEDIRLLQPVVSLLDHDKRDNILRALRSIAFKWNVYNCDSRASGVLMSQPTAMKPAVKLPTRPATVAAVKIEQPIEDLPVEYVYEAEAEEEDTKIEAVADDDVEEVAASEEATVTAETAAKTTANATPVKTAAAKTARKSRAKSTGKTTGKATSTAKTTTNATGSANTVTNAAGSAKTATKNAAAKASGTTATASKAADAAAETNGAEPVIEVQAENGSATPKPRTRRRAKKTTDKPVPPQGVVEEEPEQKTDIA